MHYSALNLCAWN